MPWRAIKRRAKDSKGKIKNYAIEKNIGSKENPKWKQVAATNDPEGALTARRMHENEDFESRLNRILSNL